MVRAFKASGPESGQGAAAADQTTHPSADLTEDARQTGHIHLGKHVVDASHTGLEDEHVDEVGKKLTDVLSDEEVFTSVSAQDVDDSKHRDVLLDVGAEAEVSGSTQDVASAVHTPVAGLVVDPLAQIAASGNEMPDAVEAPDGAPEVSVASGDARGVLSQHQPGSEEVADATSSEHMLTDSLHQDAKMLPEDWLADVMMEVMGALEDAPSGVIERMVFDEFIEMLGRLAGTPDGLEADLGHAGLQENHVGEADTGRVEDLTIGQAFEGTEGDDQYVGTGLDETLSGGGGNDVLHAGGGDDHLLGGDGRDQLFGGGGDDVIEGGAGHDWLSGGGGEDVISGGDGDDRAYGGEGDDILQGGAGNDRLLGSNGNDTLRGDQGNDKLVGGRGDDTLMGGEGNDLLKGGAGEDRLIADAGHDILRGGSGDDLFIYNVGSDMGTDTVHGGVGWTDTIQLNGVEDMPVNAIEGSTDWTLQLDGDGVDYVVDEANQSIEFQGGDASGTITLGDGSEINFSQIERIEW